MDMSIENISLSEVRDMNSIEDKQEEIRKQLSSCEDNHNGEISIPDIIDDKNNELPDSNDVKDAKNKSNSLNMKQDGIRGDQLANLVSTLMAKPRIDQDGSNTTKIIPASSHEIEEQINETQPLLKPTIDTNFHKPEPAQSNDDDDESGISQQEKWKLEIKLRIDLDFFIAMALFAQWVPRIYFNLSPWEELKSTWSIFTVASFGAAVLVYFDFVLSKGTFLEGGPLVYLYPFRFWRLHSSIARTFKVGKYNLRLGQNKFFRMTPVQQQVVLLALSIFNTLFTVAAYVHICLYKIQKYYDLNFFDIFYTITVSVTSGLSTDIVPDNMFSRVITLGVMLVGAVYLPTQLGQLMDLIKSTSKYSAPFAPKSGRNHVVILGNLEITALRGFLREFFAADHGTLTLTTHVVLLAVDEPSEDLQALLSDPVYEHRVQYVKGSPMSFKAMKSASVQLAKAAFVLASRVSDVEPIEEDARTVMRCLSLRKFHPDLMIYAQILLPRNKTHLENIADQVLCIDEFKLGTFFFITGMAAQNCLSPGFSTILYLLTNSISDHSVKILAEHVKAQWADEYLGGAQMELYQVALCDKFENMTYEEAAMFAFQQHGAVLFAIGEQDPDADELKLNLNPIGTVLKEGEIAFLIADDSKTAHKVAKYHIGKKIAQSEKMFSKDFWSMEKIKGFLAENAPKLDKKSLVNTDSQQSLEAIPRVVDKLRQKAFDLVQKKRSSSVKSGESAVEEEAPRAHSLHRSNSGQNGDFSLRRMSSAESIKARHLQDKENVSPTTDTAKQSAPSVSSEKSGYDYSESYSQSGVPARFSTVHSAIEEMDKLEYKEGISIPGDIHDHVVYCCLQENFPLAIAYFVAPFRQKDPDSAIVILCKSPPSSEEWEMIEEYQNIFYIIGTPLLRKDLRKTRITHGNSQFTLAKRTICFSDPYQANITERVSDATTLLALLNIQAMCENTDNFVTSEFIHSENMKIIGKSKTSNTKVVSSDAVEVQMQNIIPSFCGGHLFSPEMFHSVLCQAYYEKNLLAVLKGFLFNGTEEKKGANTPNTDYGNFFQEALPENDMFVGMPFGSLFSYMLWEHKCLIIALYRQNQEGNMFNYVVLNPDKSAKVQPGDAMFLLGPQPLEREKDRKVVDTRESATGAPANVQSAQAEENEKRKKKRRMIVWGIILGVIAVIIAIVLGVTLGKGSGSSSSTTAGTVSVPVASSVAVSQAVVPAPQMKVASQYVSPSCVATINMYSDSTCSTSAHPILTGNSASCASGTATFNNLIIYSNGSYYPQMSVGQQVSSCASSATTTTGYNNGVSIQLTTTSNPNSIAFVTSATVTAKDVNGIPQPAPGVTVQLLAFSDPLCSSPASGGSVGFSGTTNSQGIAQISAQYYGNSPIYLAAAGNSAVSACSGEVNILATIVNTAAPAMNNPIPTYGGNQIPGSNNNSGGSVQTTTASSGGSSGGSAPPIPASVAFTMPTYPGTAGTLYPSILMIQAHAANNLWYTATPCYAAISFYADSACTIPVAATGNNVTCSSNGVTSFQNSINITTAGQFYGIATVNGMSSPCSTSTITIQPGPPGIFTWIQTPPATANLGQSFAPMSLKLTDTFGNNITHSSGNIGLTYYSDSNCQTGVAQGTGSNMNIPLNTTTSIVTYSSFSFNMPATMYFKAVDYPAVCPCAGPTVVSDPIASISWNGQPHGGNAGQFWSFVAGVTTRNQNNIGENGGVVTFNVFTDSSCTNPLPSNYVYTSTAVSSSGYANFNNLNITKAGTFYATATSGGVSSPCSSSFTVTGGSPAYINWGSYPGGQYQYCGSGVAFSPQPGGQVEDAFGNPASGSNVCALYFYVDSACQHQVGGSFYWSNTVNMGANGWCNYTSFGYQSNGAFYAQMQTGSMFSPQTSNCSSLVTLDYEAYTFTWVNQPAAAQTHSVAISPTMSLMMYDVWNRPVGAGYLVYAYFYTDSACSSQASNHFTTTPITHSASDGSVTFTGLTWTQTGTYYFKANYGNFYTTCVGPVVFS
ncbi:hypothetical protein HDV06_000554 [Boothiomyces sp. JEL0866]|nr:hypothetical protein HDV06_000554 [Boothiomyces sp. JEL0866]